MNHFGTLYYYELKKILRRRLVWITMLICAMVIVLCASSDVTGNYYVDGKVVDTHYNMFQTDRAYRRALSGRKINQELIDETLAGYRHISSSSFEGRYTLTEEYQTYARPYSEIYNMIWSFTGVDDGSVNIYNWEASEEALYAAREAMLQSSWKALLLSEKEKEFWREKEAQVEKPFTYYYNDCYCFLLNNMPIVGLLCILFSSVCLSSVFTEEHTRRTDQLILSSAKGKGMVYLAKILAGVSVAAAGAFGLAVLTTGAAIAVYGADGFQTAIQVLPAFGFYSYPMTAGQACLVGFGCLIAASVLMSVAVMVLSEVLHSNIATLAISTGVIISGILYDFPREQKLLSQIWDCLPTRFVMISGEFSKELVHVMGHYFTRWQAVPVIYVMCSVLIAVVGVRVYRGYQVSGR